MSKSKKAAPSTSTSTSNNTAVLPMESRKIKGGIKGADDKEYSAESMVKLESQIHPVLDKANGSIWEVYDLYVEQYGACSHKSQNIQINTLWESLGIGKGTRDKWRKVSRWAIENPEQYTEERTVNLASPGQVNTWYCETVDGQVGTKGKASKGKGKTEPRPLDEKTIIIKNENAKLLGKNENLKTELKSAQDSLKLALLKLEKVTAERDVLKRESDSVQAFKAEMERNLSAMRELESLKVLAQEYAKLLNSKGRDEAKRRADTAIAEYAAKQNAKAA